MTRRTLAVVAASAVLLMVVAIPANADTVVVLSSSASPSTVTVAAGDTLTFRNDDTDRHRMRAREPQDVDSGNLEPRQSWTVRLDVPGTYRFSDERSDSPAYAVTVTVATSTDPEGGDEPAPAPRPTDTSGGGASAPTTATVTIPDRRFDPSDVTVAAGGTVTWNNLDGSHTATSTTGAFDSGVFDDGASFSHTFTTPGTYAYLCELHPEMRGTVRVVDSRGEPRESPAEEPAAAPQAPTSAPPTPPTAPTSTAPAAPSRSQSAVDIVDLAFSPATLRVDAGTTVAWTNLDAVPHTVTSSGGGPLDSPILRNGEQYTATFDEPGSYAYLCTLHPDMTATVVVGADMSPPRASEAPPTTRPSPTPTGSEREATTTSVTMDDFSFAPQETTVPVGTTIAWRNDGAVPHTATGDGFDTGIVEPGASATQTFDEAGTFHYVCALHPGMTGRVVVNATEDVVAADEDGASGGAATGPVADGAVPARNRGQGNDSGGLAFAGAVLVGFIAASFAAGRITARGV